MSPTVQVSGVDEAAIVRQERSQRGELSPAEAALVLARAKCEDVASRWISEVGLPGGLRSDRTASATDARVLVLGCDSLFEMDGVAYGKPGSAAEAKARWHLMSGSQGVLHTGHWLVDVCAGDQAAVGLIVSTTVSFVEVTDAEVSAYVSTGEPLACAGAFTIDGLGAAFVSGVNGDHHNVVGVSITGLRSMVAELGISWTELWSAHNQ
ncbi:dTTP/UTP pyrophosphatase [Austwickia sp. TVS 96-490-7B]|nr:dTTP/UTP pyrophosphatase [Austwickia sp. TVS 96-490-7B]